MYYWYWNASTKRTNDNNTSKVVFDFNSNRRHSTSSIESLEHSDNEGTRRKHMQKLRYEVYAINKIFVCKIQICEYNLYSCK